MMEVARHLIDGQQMGFRLPPLVLEDPELERDFCEAYDRKHLGYARVCLAVALVMYAAFGVLDALFAPDDLPALWLIRYGIACPALAAALVFAWRWPQAFTPHLQLVMQAVAFVAGLGIVAMIAVCQPPASDHYYAGLMLALMFVHVLSRLRFWRAAVTSLAIVASYEVVALAVNPVPGWLFASNNFFFLSTVVFGVLASFLMERMERQAFLDMQTIRDLSVRDPLTGLYNRRSLDDRLEEMLELHARYGVESALVLLDLDGFKAINDRFGHPQGDAVLRAVARSLQTAVRITDRVFRYGGDEFCLLLPNTSCTDARTLLARARRQLQGWADGALAERGLLDMSGGCVPIRGPRGSVEELIQQADALLLEAKRRGKGQILIQEADGS
jgi:diguanylate cyclase (GGDEF)-like protein